MERNLTKGSITKNIISFALPYLLAYFLQTLYGMADLFIVGQFKSVESITAVSIGSQVMHMITVIIVGLSMGTTVMIGRSIGSDNKKDINSVVGNTITLFVIVAGVLTFALLIFVSPIVTCILNTPEESVNETVAYLSICFSGLPFIIAYNVLSSIFRGFGNSKGPMYFVAIACVINILLDLFFIGVLGFGASGAAIGTVLSQTISVIIAVFFIKRQNSSIKLTKKSFRFESKILKSIVKVGLPIALQDAFIQVSFIIITIIANNRGLIDAAAVGIVEKIIGILFLVPSTMLSTVSALSSQNIGAKMHERAYKILSECIKIVVVFGIISSIFMMIFSDSVVGMFTNDENVIASGSRYLSSYVFDCIFAGVHFCFSGYFCAYGFSSVSFIHNFISIILVRIPGAYLASYYFKDDLFPMGMAAPIGSVLSVIICVGAFVYMKKKHKLC